MHLLDRVLDMPIDIINELFEDELIPIELIVCFKESLDVSFP